MNSIHLEASREDIMRVFKIMRSPLTVEEIIESLRWMKGVKKVVKELVIERVLRPYQFVTDRRNLTVYFFTFSGGIVSNSAFDSGFGDLVEGLQFDVDALDRLYNCITSKGFKSLGDISPFLVEIDPSLREEIKNRRQYKYQRVAKLWELNTRQKARKEVLPAIIDKENASKRSFKSAVEEAQFLDQVRRNQLKLYGEIKNLVSILVGIISEKRQCSVSEVFQELEV